MVAGALEPAPPARSAMAGMGALQGVALWALYEHWPEPGQALALFGALAFFVAVSGLVGHMARTGANQGRLARAKLSAAKPMILGQPSRATASALTPRCHLGNSSQTAIEVLSAR
jgi:hypothetical protein